MKFLTSLLIGILAVSGGAATHTTASAKEDLVIRTAWASVGDDPSGIAIDSDGNVYTANTE